MSHIISHALFAVKFLQFFISNFDADKIKSRISKNVKSLQTKAELSFGLYFRPHIPSKNTF